jgi:hypothetical protein
MNSLFIKGIAGQACNQGKHRLILSKNGRRDDAAPSLGCDRTPEAFLMNIPELRLWLVRGYSY